MRQLDKHIAILHGNRLRHYCLVNMMDHLTNVIEMAWHVNVTSYLPEMQGYRLMLDSYLPIERMGALLVEQLDRDLQDIEPVNPTSDRLEKGVE